MGLDNGICVKRNEYTNSISELLRFSYSWDKEKKWPFEICYWRKCWNIRAMIFDMTRKSCGNDESITLTQEDIFKIIAGLKSFNEENWEDYGSSIWEWYGDDDYAEYVQGNIANLEELYELMNKYDLEVYFYDSY